MSTTSLFDTAPPKVVAKSASEQIAEWFAACDTSQNPAFEEALRSLPVELAESAAHAAKVHFRGDFERLAKIRLSMSSDEREHCMSLKTIENSARLSATSALFHLARAPWHAAPPNTAAEVNAALRGGKSLTGVYGLVYAAADGCHLYVAAESVDDRDSYVQRVKRLIKAHPVVNLVVDAEMVEWNPVADILEFAQQVGHPISYLGTAERSRAARHSMLTDGACGKPVVFVSSSGSRLQPDSAGGVCVTATSRRETAARVPDEPAPRPAAAPSPAPAGAKPPSSFADRMAQARSQQRRHLPSPRA